MRFVITVIPSFIFWSIVTSVQCARNPLCYPARATSQVMYDLITTDTIPKAPAVGYQTVTTDIEQRCFGICLYDERCLSFTVVSNSTQIDCNFYNSSYLDPNEHVASSGARYYSDNFCSPCKRIMENCLCDCRKPVNTENILRKECLDWRAEGYSRSGVYTILQTSGTTTREALCDMETDGGGYTVYQHRFNGQLSFDRTFNEYKDGFGDAWDEYWLGIERLPFRPMTYFVGQKFNGDVGVTKFDSFALVPMESFRMVIGRKAPGYTIDPFTDNNMMLFQTPDTATTPCVGLKKSGWWFAVLSPCSGDNLNGVYSHSPNSSTDEGIIWMGFTSESLMTIRMMYREEI